MKRRMLTLLLAACLVLSGCGGSKEAPPVRGTPAEAMQETVEEPAETPEPEISESVDESEEEPEAAEPAEEEEAKPEATELDATLAEYLKSLDDTTYAVGRNDGYEKFRFYADDINGDGYPEVFQYMERDVTATIKDFCLAVYTMNHRWDEEKRREIYCADLPFANACSHNSLKPFGAVEIDFSYTRGTEKMLMHYEICSGIHDTQTTYDEVKVFRDGKMLDYGFANRDVTDYDTSYIIIAPDYKTYRDKEHYDSFDRGSDYETVIRFGAEECWTTLQDALDHLGELP